MGRQTEVRDIRAIDEARGHHPPADGALEAAKGQQRNQPPAIALGDGAAKGKPGKRQGEGQPDQPPELTVDPFPEIDELEVIEAHALVYQLIFRDLAIFFELGLPCRIAERRNGASDGFPLRDGKPGFGQPRDAADNDHQEDEQGDGKQPAG